MAWVRVEGELRGFYERAGVSGRSAREGVGNDGTKIPEHIDWNAHRIASSQRYSTSLKEIEWEWSIDDVWDANEVLDLYEEMERKASEEMKKRSWKK